MKHLLKLVVCATSVILLSNCSTEPIGYTEEELIALEENGPCFGNNPEARITNNGTVPIDLDILDDNDTVVAFVHNLLPGNTSSWLSFQPGEILFSVSNDFVEDEKVIYIMNTCMIFDMEVEVTNSLSSAEPESI